jgi:4'-phosphopantetheinyl transferase
VHLWRSDTRAADLLQVEACLPADELRKARSFRQEADRRRALVSRWLVRQALSRCAAARPGDLAFDRTCTFCGGDHGKPRITGPEPAAFLRFNVAHSGDLVVLAVARGREVGVDVERIPATLDVDAIAAQAFTARERATLDAAPPAGRAQAFLEIWSAKEAYLKMSGRGLGVALDQVDPHGGPRPAEGLAALERCPEWSLSPFHAGDGYVAALCVEGRPPTLRHWRLP